MSGFGVPVAVAADALSLQPNAELLDLCTAFLAMGMTISAMPDEDNLALALKARDSLACRIQAIPPVSPDGVRLKAQVGVVLLDEGHPPDLPGDGVDFALTFLRDLATGVSCAGLEITGPDAELLAACAAFDALEHEAMGLHEGAGQTLSDEERGTALAAIMVRQKPWLERMCALRVASPVAWQARARSLALCERDMLAGYESGRIHKRLLAALLRDMAA